MCFKNIIILFVIALFTITDHNFEFGDIFNSLD